MQIKRVLLVEDNLLEQEKIKKYLFALKIINIEIATNKDDAYKLFMCHPFDLVITDMYLTNDLENSSAIFLIKEIKEEQPETIVIAITSSPNVNIYEKAMEVGANYFLKKPIKNTDELAIALDNAINDNTQKLHLQSSKNNTNNDIIIEEQIQKLIIRVAQNQNQNIPVIIYGETGTGKEEIAKLIYKSKKTLDNNIPFVAVNCANLSEQLFESLVFGHKKGSFSGADETTTGYIAAADGGILFLDEVQALNITCQSKLLRVLNDGSYQRLGSTHTLYSRFQPIVATTKNLEEEVNNHSFLLDLYMRLTGIYIYLKPLRERLYDIPLLLRTFLLKNQIKISNKNFNEVVLTCQKLNWKGNIRQLIMNFHLMLDIDENNEQFLNINFLFNNNLNNKEKNNSTVEQHYVLSRIYEDHFLQESVDIYETLLLKEALLRHKGNASKLCQALNIPRSSYENKKKKYGL